MSDEPIEAPPALPPLGPGDDDPRSPAAGVAVDATGPLAPGDDDPRSPARVVPSAPVIDTPNPDDDFHFLAPAAAGPGDPQVGPRHVVRIPKVSTPPEPADAVHEKEQE